MAITTTDQREEAPLATLEAYEWAHELVKLHWEFPRATREQVLKALDTAYKQHARAPMEDQIERFARSLLRTWLARAYTGDAASAVGCLK